MFVCLSVCLSVCVYVVELLLNGKSFWHAVFCKSSQIHWSMFVYIIQDFPDTYMDAISRTVNSDRAVMMKIYRIWNNVLRNLKNIMSMIERKEVLTSSLLQKLRKSLEHVLINISSSSGQRTDRKPDTNRQNDKNA